MSRKKKSEDYGVTWKCKLKVFRAMNDLTQEDLAEKLKVTRQTISSIEKGKYNPSLILAYRIANYFGIKIEEMFEFKEIERIQDK